MIKSQSNLLNANGIDAPISDSLKYLKKRFPQVEALQISATGVKDYTGDLGVRVLSGYYFSASTYFKKKKHKAGTNKGSGNLSTLRSLRYNLFLRSL